MRYKQSEMIGLNEALNEGLIASGFKTNTINPIILSVLKGKAGPVKIESSELTFTGIIKDLAKSDWVKKTKDYTKDVLPIENAYSENAMNIENTPIFKEVWNRHLKPVHKAFAALFKLFGFNLTHSKTTYSRGSLMDDGEYLEIYDDMTYENKSRLSFHIKVNASWSEKEAKYFISGDNSNNTFDVGDGNYDKGSLNMWLVFLKTAGIQTK